MDALEIAAMRLIDSHAHLDDACFDADRDEVLAEFETLGGVAVIVPAINPSNWQAVSDTVSGDKRLFAAYGIHPMFADDLTEQNLKALEAWIKVTPTVAIGECGLDYSTKLNDRERQNSFFHHQLMLAKKHSLPVIVHDRKATDDILKQINQTHHHHGVVHSFAGSFQQAQRLIDAGYYLSFGGAATHQRAKKLQRLIKQLPLDALLIETDSPYQPPAGHRGKRNQPALLVDILELFDRCRCESREEIANATTDNAIQLFNLPIVNQ